MRRVLIIDDDQSVGTAIQMMLARQGYDTALALNARDGLQVFQSSRFDIAMIDIFMPGTDGLEIIKDLRERAPTMTIVAMSGFRYRNSTANTPDFLGMAAGLGATTCLRKPFAPKQLMEAINSGFDPAIPLTARPSD